MPYNRLPNRDQNAEPVTSPLVPPLCTERESSIVPGMYSVHSGYTVLKAWNCSKLTLAPQHADIIETKLHFKDILPKCYHSGILPRKLKVNAGLKLALAQNAVECSNANLKVVNLCIPIVELLSFHNVKTVMHFSVYTNFKREISPLVVDM